jgi:hypothetical protein
MRAPFMTLALDFVQLWFSQTSNLKETFSMIYIFTLIMYIELLFPFSS